MDILETIAARDLKVAKCRQLMDPRSFEHGYQTVKCVTAVKKRNQIHVLPVLRVRCSKR